MNAERVRTSRFARLTTLDRMFLHLETPDWPGHFGGLAVVEGNALLDGSGQLRMAEIRERVDRRLAHVRQLRQRLYVPVRWAGSRCGSTILGSTSGTTFTRPQSNRQGEIRSSWTLALDCTDDC